MIARSRTACAWLLGCLLALAQTELIGADKNQEKKDDQKVREAQNGVDAAKKRQAAARGELEKAVTALRMADSDRERAAQALKRAREQVEVRLTATLGLTDARRKLSGADEAYQQLRGAVLKELAATPKFQEAAAKVAAAKAKLEEVRASTTLSAEQKQVQLVELAREGLLTSKLENHALEAHPQAQAAHEKLAAARAQVAKLVDAVEAGIETDSAVRKAREAFQNEQNQYAQAESVVRREQTQATQAAAALKQAENKLAQARAADKRNDGSKKDDKKKDGKKK